MPFTLPLLALFFVAGEPAPLERVGRLDDPAIAEASGLVQSRRHPGIFWVLNDSGNLPVLYAVKRDGSLVNEFRVAVGNIDWEDLAIDEAGHLFIGEIGNNEGRLPLRAIYRVDEPDPRRRKEEPLPVTLASYYRFGRKARFDAEGLFIAGGRALIVAKTFDGSEADLYAVPLDPPAPLLKPAIPQRIGTLPGFTEPATGACLSAAGERLAVCSPSALRVYEKQAQGERGWSLIGQVHYPPGDIEAVCWDGMDLILASEDRSLYRVDEAAWRKGSR